MKTNKPRRLSEITNEYAPQGSNDRLWATIEHQLEQIRLSSSLVEEALETIAYSPENEEERLIAEDCKVIYRGTLRQIYHARSSFLHYLSDTDVPERISRKETENHEQQP